MATSASMIKTTFLSFIVVPGLSFAEHPFSPAHDIDYAVEAQPLCLHTATFT
jgi:hypothetical protein